MITLSNLHEQSLQDVFNHVVKHLLEQNKKSKFQTSCAYKGYDGLKCAVGCIISEKEYRLSMEGLSCTKVISKENPYVSMNMHNMLRDLQVIHDDIEVDEWRNELKKLTSKYVLKIEGALLPPKKNSVAP